MLKLRDQESTQDIVLLMSGKDGNTRLAYNVHNLNESHIVNGNAGNGKDFSTRTIEFRGHEGTMDPDRIINWINVCVGFVEFADTVDSNLLDQFLQTHVDDTDSYEDYNVIDLLRALGQPTAAEFYLKRFEDNPQLLSDESDEEDEEESRSSSTTSNAPETSEEVRQFLESLGDLESQQ